MNLNDLDFILVFFSYIKTYSNPWVIIFVRDKHARALTCTRTHNMHTRTHTYSKYISSRAPHIIFLNNFQCCICVPCWHAHGHLFKYLVLTFLLVDMSIGIPTKWSWLKLFFHRLCCTICWCSWVSQAPYQKKLMDTKLMTPEEIEWVDTYHANCREILSPLLNKSEMEWLRRATEPISATAWLLEIARNKSHVWC